MLKTIVPYLATVATGVGATTSPGTGIEIGWSGTAGATGGAAGAGVGSGAGTGAGWAAV